MKQHTQQEARDALAKLPKPLLGFVDSQKLSDLYFGIQKKHNFTLAQIVAIARATNYSLIGLELESALETNLHQLLPELSNAANRELVADINDRIFKEAHRRGEENIIEQNPMTLNAESSPLTEEEKKHEEELRKVEILEDGSPELIALREAENKEYEERRAREREEDKELVAREPRETNPEVIDPGEKVRQMFEWIEKNPNAPIEEAPFYKPEPTPEEELAAEEKLEEEKSGKMAPSLKLAQSTATRSTEKKLSAQGAVDGVRVSSISDAKLRLPTTTTPTVIVAEKPLFETGAKETVSVTPQAALPILPPSAPPIPKRADGIDPYRELPD